MYLKTSSCAPSQVLFQYLPEHANGAGDTFLSIPLRNRNPEGTKSQAKMDLVFTISGTLLAVDYMTELYDVDTVLRLLDSVGTVLEHCMTRSEAPFMSISLLGPMDLQQLVLFSCGPPQPQYLDGPFVHEAVAGHAADMPNARCLVFEGAEMSYGAVNVAAEAVARTLAAAHAGRGAVVGVMLERSLELPIAFLGVLKAGASFVPLDPAYPDDRLAGYLKDASATVLLTQDALLDKARALIEATGSSTRIVLAADAIVGGAMLPAVPASYRELSFNSKAYILFTSGSTGRPKGVVVTHGGLRDLLCCFCDRLCISHDAVSVLTHSGEQLQKVADLVTRWINDSLTQLFPLQLHLMASCLHSGHHSMLVAHSCCPALAATPTLVRATAAAVCFPLPRHDLTPCPHNRLYHVTGCGAWCDAAVHRASARL